MFHDLVFFLSVLSADVVALKDRVIAAKSAVSTTHPLMRPGGGYLPHITIGRLINAIDLDVLEALGVETAARFTPYPRFVAHTLVVMRQEPDLQWRDYALIELGSGAIEWLA